MYPSVNWIVSFEVGIDETIGINTPIANEITRYSPKKDLALVLNCWPHNFAMIQWGRFFGIIWSFLYRYISIYIYIFIYIYTCHERQHHECNSACTSSLFHPSEILWPIWDHERCKSWELVSDPWLGYYEQDNFEHVAAVGMTSCIFYDEISVFFTNSCDEVFFFDKFMINQRYLFRKWIQHDTIVMQDMVQNFIAKYGRHFAVSNWYPDLPFPLVRYPKPVHVMIRNDLWLKSDQRHSQYGTCKILRCMNKSQWIHDILHNHLQSPKQNMP